MRTQSGFVSAAMVVIPVLLVLSACGGGDPEPPPPASQAVGGTVSGLAGAGLVLQNNASSDLTITSNGTFVFPVKINQGASYGVTVKTQPTNPWQTCTVANPSGTVASTPVANANVSCATNSYTLGAQVVGLSRSRFRTPLVLTDGNGNDVSVSTDGAAGFVGPKSSGLSYTVSVKQQPTLPALECSVVNAAGAITNANVTVLVECDPTRGRFVHVTSNIDATSTFEIGTDGALHQVYGTMTPHTPHIVAVDPSGLFAYVATRNGGNGLGGIQPFSIDQTTGFFTAVGTQLAADASPNAMTVEPTGRYLYVANAHGGATSQGSVSAYSIAATGSLTEVPGSPWTVNYAPRDIATDPTGTFVFTANAGSETTSSFRIDGATGALTPVAGSPFAAGLVPTGVAVHPSGRFVYTDNSNTVAGLSAYSLDAVSGVLTPLTAAPIDVEGGGQIAMDPRGRYLVQSHWAITTGIVNVYSIDPTSGLPTLAAGSPHDIGHPTIAASFDPSGEFLYVLVAGGVTLDIAVYAVDNATGNLAEVAGSPFSVSSSANSLFVR